MNNKNVDLFYQLVDEACMKLYQELNINYLEALLHVSDDLVDHFDDTKLDEEASLALNNIYQKLQSEHFYSEEIRLGLQLLIVKAFKHINYSLDLMTPDIINYLFAHLISKLTTSDIRILDTALGTGNTLNAICNYPDINVYDAIGIEDDMLLVNLAKAASNLQNNGLKIYYQDACASVLDVVDIIIGDLPNDALDNPQESFDYLPYLIILKRLENLTSGGYFIYLIDNDFFSHNNSNIFKQQLEKEATLLALLVLDDKIFKSHHQGKSILIGQKQIHQSYNVHLATLNLTTKEEISRTIENIDKWIETI